MPLLFRLPRGVEAVAAFRSALAFLTRIPYASGGAMSMKGSIYWHGMAGLVVGISCTAVAGLFWFGSAECLSALSAVAAGWIYVAMEAWITRGLHWDGVADIGDALGSGAIGERFWLILKDSRLGAFGAMALILVFALQASAAALLFGKIPVHGVSASLALILAPAWARLTVPWLGFGGIGHHGSALGAVICEHVNGVHWLLAWIQAICILSVCFMAGLAGHILLFLLAAQIGLNIHFRRLGRRHGGLSGDFFGCFIEVSQTGFLLLAACAI